MVFLLKPTYSLSCVKTINVGLNCVKKLFFYQNLSLRKNIEIFREKITFGGEKFREKIRKIPWKNAFFLKQNFFIFWPIFEKKKQYLRPSMFWFPRHLKFLFLKCWFTFWGWYFKNDEVFFFTYFPFVLPKLLPPIFKKKYSNVVIRMNSQKDNFAYESR